MARPKKNTVDYFPHDCHPNKELEIFINKHGNEGYAFFYRLREVLGITKGHGYCADEKVDMAYLCKKTGVDEKLLIEMVEFLCEIGEINKKIWRDNYFIWWPNFVDSLKELYKRRKNDLPNYEKLTLFRKELKVKVFESYQENKFLQNDVSPT